MTCGRCHQPIQDGEKYKDHIPHGASGAAPSVRMHEPACRPAPHQSTPAGLGR